MLPAQSNKYALIDASGVHS